MNVRTLLIACGLLAAPAFLTPALAYQGCFFEPYWPWESESPINQLKGAEIDVYIDDSFYDADSGFVNNLPRAVAEAYAVQVIANFHTESGASFTLDYRGRSTNNTCWTGANFARPTIVINTVPSQSDLDDFCTVQPGATACANWTVDSDGTYCGSIYFIDSTSPAMSHYGFRSTLLHELMHTFNYAHPVEDQCDARHLTYDSVTHTGGTHPTDNRSRHLTQADKRYLQDDYNILQSGQNGVYARYTEPFDDYAGFSAAALMYSDEATNGAVAASDGETHDYGFVFNEYESSVMPDPFPVSYLYRSGQGWLRRVLLSSLNDENWSHYTPDVVTGRTATNRYYAAAVLGADRFTDRRTDVFFQEMNFSNFGTWGSPTRMFGSPAFEEPNVALAFDPITRRYVIAYTGNSSEDSEGILRLRTRKPTGTTWPEASRKIDNSGVRFIWGVDIACSPTMNTFHGSNCVAVGIAEQRADNTPGRVAFRFFKLVVDANDVAQVVFENYDDTMHYMVDQSLIYSKPRVTANPLANANPQFVYSFTKKVDVAGDVQFWARLADQYDNENVPVLNTNLRQLTAWDHLPAALGSHVYSGNAYLDAAYSAP